MSVTIQNLLISDSKLHLRFKISDKFSKTKILKTKISEKQLVRSIQFVQSLLGLHHWFAS